MKQKKKKPVYFTEYEMVKERNITKLKRTGK